MSFLTFVWHPSGYELREHDGDPPSVGDVLEEDGAEMSVVKVAVSPLPHDDRRCAYLQPA